MSGSDISFSSGAIQGRYVSTLNPSKERWFQHFSLGVSMRMGDVVKQDRAYTVEVVHAVINLFEEDFQCVGYRMTVNEMSAAMFFIASCFGGFRGFETVWTDLGALRYDI